MEDDGNAMSWVPTNEIVDSINIEANIVNDLDDDGWVLDFPFITKPVENKSLTPIKGINGNTKLNPLKKKRK